MKTTQLACALFAMPALHAQNDCNNLQILLVEYAPFTNITNSALQVTVQNGSSGIFGYPEFFLVNDIGDTLARSVFGLFGIAPDVAEVHPLALEPGMELPGTPFTGTLVLNYLTLPGEEPCIFHLQEIELCPQSECSLMQVFLYNNHIDPVTTSFAWEITNAGNEVVGSGELSIDASEQQQDIGDVCLPVGDYTFHIEQNGSDGMAFIAGVGQIYMSGPNGVMDPGGAIDLPFTYYAGCSAVGTGVNDDLPSPSPPLLFIDQRSLTIISNNGKPLGRMMIFDGTGRRLKELTVGWTSATIDLSELASGIHIIGSMDGTSWTAQRFILY